MNTYRVVCEGTGARPHPRRDVATLRVGREWEAAESWAVELLQRAGFDDAEAREYPDGVEHMTTFEPFDLATGETLRVRRRDRGVGRVETSTGPVWEFRCPKCGRAPRVREVALTGRLAAASMSGRRDLLLSALE